MQQDELVRRALLGPKSNKSPQAPDGFGVRDLEFLYVLLQGFYEGFIVWGFRLSISGLRGAGFESKAFRVLGFGV